MAWEGLEPRQLMCAVHAAASSQLTLWARTAGDASLAAGPSALASTVSPAAVGIAANAPSGLPWLHSLPGATVAIFLDFDGNGASTAYDTDGRPATFDATEQKDITEAWRHVASYFSMFNADVTTQPPTGPYSYSLISNSHTGVGYSYLQFPTTSPSAFNPSGDARSRQSGLAHEIGHNFSLAHQSDFDAFGEKTNEYSSGYDSLHGPIMGVDYAQTIHKWFIGHPSHSPSLLQDDVATIADRINNHSGGDGFRPDDVPNVIGSARALVADATGTYAASGIIERMADADAFSFTSGGGQARVDVATPSPSMLDAKLEVYDADGTLVATADASTNDQHLSVPVLGAGTFYAVVKSHGNYGDLGPYDLTVRSLPAEFSSRDVGGVGQKGYAAYDAAGGSYGVAGGGADVGSTSDEFHFAYTQLAGDGSITARVLSQENTGARAAAGVMIREGLGAGSRHAMMGLSPAGGAQFRSRSAAGGSTSTASAAGISAPYWVRLVRSGTTVTGFRSADGIAWTESGTMTLPSTSSPVYVGLAVTAGNDANLNEARFDGVSLEGDFGLPDPVYSTIPTPTGLTLSHAAAGTGLQASWDPVAGAAGYAVERSVDGVNWTSGGLTAADVTTWSDASPAGSLRYFYRVAAQDDAGRSRPSAPASIVNRPSAPTGLAVTSWQTDKLILNWRDANGEDGYRVERAPEGSDAWVVRAALGANVPSFTDTNLATGTRYRYRVIATSPSGDGGTAETTGTTRLPAVTGVAFTEKLYNRLSLKWNAVPGATSYRIRRSTNGTDYTTAATVTGTTYDDRAVSALKEYYYRVVAIDSRAESMNGNADEVFAATPASAPLPAGWGSRDVGSPGGSGASGVTGGTWTVVSSGSDITGAGDSFRFTYQTLVGDGVITARVATQEDTGGWAKAGVMVRENFTPGSRHAMMVVTPDNGVSFQHRSSAGGSTANPNTFAGPKAPYWVRLERRGNVITASRSSDGAAWTTQGSVTIAIARTAYVGLAVTATDNSELATVTFTNVTLSNAAPTIATPAAARPPTVAGASAALSVLGADDHGEPVLTYTWSATSVPDGAAAPTFSDNGTNASKEVTATFFRAGTYTFQVRVADASGLSATSEVAVTVEPTATAVAIVPSDGVRVAPRGTIQFSAAVVDQFGQPLGSQPELVAWAASGGAMDPTTGLYTAPAVPGTYTISVLADAFTASVDVEVAAADVTAPAIRSVASRKTHGPRGDFDLPLSLAADASAATVEPRLGGPTVLVFTFDEPVVPADGTLDGSEFLVEGATLSSAKLDESGTVMTVTLAGVPDRGVISVTVAGLADGSGNQLGGDSDVFVRAIPGDVNGSGSVNELDFLLVRRALFRDLGNDTFLADLDLDGQVDTLDLLLARRNAGTVVS